MLRSLSACGREEANKRVYLQAPDVEREAMNFSFMSQCWSQSVMH